MNNKGMTLLEIVISMLILSLVTIGTANVFISAKKHIVFNRSKIVAAGLARYYMDGLQVNVTQANWGEAGNDLTSTSGAYVEFNNTFNPHMNYTLRRRVDPIVSSGIDLRRVILTVAWNETSS